MTYIIVSWMDTISYSDIAVVLEADGPKLFGTKEDAVGYAIDELNGEFKTVKV